MIFYKHMIYTCIFIIIWSITLINAHYGLYSNQILDDQSLKNYWWVFMPTGIYHFGKIGEAGTIELTYFDWITNFS